MEIPKEVEITVAEAKELRLLEERQKELASFVSMVITEGEQQTRHISQTAIKVWGDLAEKYGLDLANVVYAPHKVENKLVPIQIKLSPENKTQGNI